MASPPRPELPLKFSLRRIPTNRSQLRPVLVPSELRSWLARLQLARADAIQGDTGKAKAAYQDFLTLWKDADPDIPILIAAKAEYAKLWSFLAEILRSSFASSW